MQIIRCPLAYVRHCLDLLFFFNEKMYISHEVILLIVSDLFSFGGSSDFLSDCNVNALIWLEYLHVLGLG